MYLAPVLILWFAKGRGYYTAGTYPMLMAMGAALIESWLMRLRRPWQGALQAGYLAALFAWGLYVSTSILPLASNGPLRDIALYNNGDLREEIGWNELVQKVAVIRDSFPEQQRKRVGVIVGNYGEQGAIEILGPAYHLPQPISGTNSAWLRGYPIPPPSILIVLGLSRKTADQYFTSCTLAGHNSNSEGVHNEESDDHPDILVCGPPRLPWPELWQKLQSFG